MEREGIGSARHEAWGRLVREESAGHGVERIAGRYLISSW